MSDLGVATVVVSNVSNKPTVGGPPVFSPGVPWWILCGLGHQKNLIQYLKIKLSQKNLN